MLEHYAKKASFSFVLLTGLTVISALLGYLMPMAQTVTASSLLWLVLLTVIIKGWQIVDIFMELKQAPKLWRGLLLGYISILPIIIGLIYWL